MNQPEKRPLAEIFMGLLAFLGACGFWFLMLWFGTKE